MDESRLERLRIKYGLGVGEPTQEQAVRWDRQVREKIEQGEDPERAGELAAQQTFRTYRRFHFAAQADTIYDLLGSLGKK